MRRNSWSEQKVTGPAGRHLYGGKGGYVKFNKLVQVRAIRTLADLLPDLGTGVGWVIGNDRSDLDAARDSLRVCDVSMLHQNIQSRRPCAWLGIPASGKAAAPARHSGCAQMYKRFRKVNSRGGQTGW